MRSNGEVAAEIVQLAKSLGWKRRDTRLADTGSVYIELTRRLKDKKEWVVIRVADHKQVYHEWMTTYSVSRFEMHPEEIKFILSKPFGEVGDVL